MRENSAVEPEGGSPTGENKISFQKKEPSPADTYC